MELTYILVIIDTFTRYVEFFPKQEVTTIAAADALLWRHPCRFTEPLEFITDFGSQFVNNLLAHFHQEMGITHHTTIPYSKEENGTVERANKEVNHYIRNIFFDVGNVKHWSRVLCTTERVLNNSVKQPLGASPNTLLLGKSFSVDRILLTQTDVKPRTTQDFVDTLMIA